MATEPCKVTMTDGPSKSVLATWLLATTRKQWLPFSLSCESQNFGICLKMRLMKFWPRPKTSLSVSDYPCSNSHNSWQSPAPFGRILDLEGWSESDVRD